MSWKFFTADGSEKQTDVSPVTILGKYKTTGPTTSATAGWQYLPNSAFTTADGAEITLAGSSHWDSTNNLLTIPVDGWYRFDYYLAFTATSWNEVKGMALDIDGAGAGAPIYPTHFNDGNYIYNKETYLIHLTEDQTVEPTWHQTSAVARTMQTANGAAHFGWELVKAT